MIVYIVCLLCGDKLKTEVFSKEWNALFYVDEMIQIHYNDGDIIYNNELSAGEVYNKVLKKGDKSYNFIVKKHEVKGYYSETTVK